MKKEELTPQEYFDSVKERKQKITDKELIQIYDTCLELINKYKITGQTKGLKKLIFHLENIEREREIVKLGIDTFVYQDDVEYYIDNVADNAVKLIELENYEREIPDEVVNVVEKVKDKFDQLYIIFTDYTGKVERQIKKERRAKDPILFGTFQDPKTKTVIDRFYFIADWEDEYCHLTLDKMVGQMKQKNNTNIIREISTPKDIKELKQQLLQLEETSKGYKMDNVKKRQGLFSKIKTFLSKK